MINNSFFFKKSSWIEFTLRRSFMFFIKIISFAFLLSSFNSYSAIVDDFDTIEKTVDPINLDGFPVTVTIEGVGSFDIDVLYTDKNLLYINIQELFSILKIPCNYGSNGLNLEGFVGKEQYPYSVDFANESINVGGRIIKLKGSLLKEEGALYMESSSFLPVFGIKMDFNYRSLTIKLKADFELPVEKQMRLDKIRTNISKLKGEQIVDTIINRNYHVFKFGTIDWSASSFLVSKGLTTNIIGLNVGAELLYGEANVAMIYNDKIKFDNRQLRYLWQWVDNDKTIIKQAQVGKISVPMYSFINAPLIGATIRNSSTSVRKAKGSYVISDFTEPNWTVELYINNVLVNFTTADASGAFVFNVPNVYGFSTLKLKYYGPLGEERVEERVMNVPYTVMAVNEFEYGLSAGMIEDGNQSRFGKAEFNYGLNRFITVGGGVEYVSTLPNGGFLPFFKTTIQPFSKMLLNGEYVHGVRSRALLNYYLTKNILLELDYANYVDGQVATVFNASEEFKAKISVPFKFKKINGFLKMDYSKLAYKNFDYNFANFIFSSYYKNISFYTSSQMNWVGNNNLFVTNDLALSYRLKSNIVLRTSARYNATNGLFLSYRGEVEKRTTKGYYAVSFEKNLLSNDHFLNLSYKYDLPFARTNVGLSQSRNQVVSSMGAQGSLALGAGGHNQVYTSNNSSVSKGGILIYPFLDINHNGVFDKGEHLVKINNVKVNGGQAIFNEKDLIVRIPNLNAFSDYTLTFSDTELDNIAWRFKDKFYQVMIDPNQFKRIDVPIQSMGEISGMVYLDKGGLLKGLGRVLIKVYKKGSDKIVSEILSESDGYIYLLGLKPGEYRACIDSEQLSNLNFVAEPACRYFTIKVSEDGDIIEGMDFVLKSKAELP
jgi:hypothetical protein